MPKGKAKIEREGETPLVKREKSIPRSPASVECLCLLSVCLYVCRTIIKVDCEKWACDPCVDASM